MINNYLLNGLKHIADIYITSMLIIRLSSSELSLNLFLYLYQMTIDTLIEQVNKAIEKSNIVIAQAVKD